MTDWLDDLLDTQVGESPPEGFAERVVAVSVRGQERGHTAVADAFGLEYVPLEEAM